MKLHEIVDERGNQTRDMFNPLPFDQKLARDTFDQADEVEDALMVLYKKKHNITDFDPRTYAKNMQTIRQTVGTVRSIPINRIVATEENLYKSQIKGLQQGTAKSSSTIPLVYKVKDKYVISDGNHRIAALHLKGETTVKALTIDLAALAQQLNI